LPTNKSGKAVEGSYTDTITAIEKDSPDSFATYAVEVLNTDGRGAGISNQVRVPLAHTLPPPQNFEARLTRDGVLLSWSAVEVPVSQPGVHYVYRVYRQPEGSNERVLAGQLPVGTEKGYLLTDSNIEWEKTYEYRAETVTLIDAPGKAQIQVEGDDTPAVKVFADDVFPPAVPAGLQAVFSGPGQKPFIDLVWAPVTDTDLSGYNVYRAEEGGVAIKINTGLVRAPAYRDMNVQSGKRYTYSVSSVDLRGNESARSESASESVP
jgi:fibronectin type 3 domain-containing protein